MKHRREIVTGFFTEEGSRSGLVGLSLMGGGKVAFIHKLAGDYLRPRGPQPRGTTHRKYLYKTKRVLRRSTSPYGTRLRHLAVNRSWYEILLANTSIRDIMHLWLTTSRDRIHDLKGQVSQLAGPPCHQQGTQRSLRPNSVLFKTFGMPRRLTERCIISQKASGRGLSTSRIAVIALVTKITTKQKGYFGVPPAHTEPDSATSPSAGKILGVEGSD